MIERTPKPKSGESKKQEKYRLTIIEHFKLPKHSSWDDIREKVDPAWINVLTTDATITNKERHGVKEGQEKLARKHAERHLHDCSDGVREVEAILENYAANSVLVRTLFKITDPTEAYESMARKSAKNDLALVFAKLNELNDTTDIAPETYNELFGRWQVLNHAIGIINNGTVDHNR